MPVIGIELFGLGSLAGMLIGCVGVGGVILVPAMSLGLGIPVAPAAAAAMFGYMASGLLGTILLG